MNSRKNRICYFLASALICSFSSSEYVKGMEKRDSGIQNDPIPGNGQVANDFTRKKRKFGNKTQQEISPFKLLNISGSEGRYQANSVALPEEKILAKLLSIMGHRIRRIHGKIESSVGDSHKSNNYAVRFIRMLTRPLKDDLAHERADAVRNAVEKAGLLQCRQFDTWYLACFYCNKEFRAINMPKLNKSEKIIYNFLRRNDTTTNENDIPAVESLTSQQRIKCFQTQEKINKAMREILKALAPIQASNPYYDPQGLFGDDWIKDITADDEIYFNYFTNPNPPAS